MAILKRFMLCFLLKLYYILEWNMYVITVFYSRQYVFSILILCAVFR